MRFHLSHLLLMQDDDLVRFVDGGEAPADGRKMDGASLQTELHLPLVNPVAGNCNYSFASQPLAFEPLYRSVSLGFHSKKVLIVRSASLT